jgi:hypothetical protein
VQSVEEIGDLRGDEQPVAGAESGDPLAGADELLDPFPQLMVDLGERRGESFRVGGEQLLDAGERHAGVGERFDLDEVDGVLRAVAPVA